ncbi:bar adaptor protein [Lichtheimia corymbifera JMRC:FSU:9682]|uniref:Bar adaptor protein n=1 Tax=Lichtheimia corymbifera JMRC:FSU:9682 TaxID=1263082 RepID=A0A068RZE2_9FUNG|nr:bar adaptor protein [Lichtheimia corymbifera JMRC:FSU:9682]
MSWKGIQKAVSRLPHQILSKKSETTNDQEYAVLERRFNEFQKVVERLEKDAEAFRDAVAALLTHQAAMTSFLTVIYDPQLGVQSSEGVQRRFQQTPASATQAANDAEAAMAYCRDEVLPELDAIDRDVVRPMLELKEIMKTIHKTMVKRNHKMIDYDRHRTALNKLKAKEERSFSEEKQIFKVENQLETATQDYEYLNDMLKSELPKFFAMKAQFIQPVFDHLYFMQCKVYGMIYARCYELINANQSHFMTHAMPIEAGYEWRKSQFDARAELENLDLLKSGGKAWLSVSGGANNSKLSLKERAALRAQEEQKGSPAGPSSYGSSPAATGYEEGPPAYGASAGTTSLDSTPMSYGKQHQRSGSRTGPAPPPPPPIANKPSSQYVVALYDYDAQAEGDLSFKRDDKIELIERTADQNDWWTGRLRGVTGIFPGNYVSEL